MGDERAREREIRLSPKGMEGRVERHGPKDYAPYSGRSAVVARGRRQQRS